MRKPELSRNLLPILPLALRERELLHEYGGCCLEAIAGTKYIIVTWQDGSESRPLPWRDLPNLLFWFPNLQAWFRQVIDRNYGKPWMSPGFAEYLDILDNYYLSGR
jgi:hypothetical protein